MSNEGKAKKEIQKVLKKHGLKIDHNLSFPVYRQLPDEVKLAMGILRKHGMRIKIILVPIKK